VPLAGIVLALGSVWTLIPAAIALIITVIRTALEDRTLRDDLTLADSYDGNRRQLQRYVMAHLYNMIDSISPGPRQACLRVRRRMQEQDLTRDLLH